MTPNKSIQSLFLYGHIDVNFIELRKQATSTRSQSYIILYMHMQHVTFKSNYAYCDVAVWKPCEKKTKTTEKSSNSHCHLWPLTCWDPGTANLRAFHPTYSWHYVVSCRLLQSLLSGIEHQLIRNIFKGDDGVQVSHLKYSFKVLFLLYMFVPLSSKVE